MNLENYLKANIAPRKRKAFLLVSLILLHPIWILPLVRILPFHAFLYREVYPDMPQQEECLTEVWNCWVDMFFLPGHPEIADAYTYGVRLYRLAGRPDLATMMRGIGRTLLLWGLFSKFYAIFMFHTLLIYPYLPIQYRIKLWKLALVMIFAFIVYAFIILPFFLRLVL